jgi:hypothetical protein
VRSRTVLSVVAALGALGALALAGDMYRRIVDAELAGKASQAALAGTQIFGMVHVVGAAALGVLLLAIALLIVNENETVPRGASQDAPAEPVDSKTAAPVATATPIEVRPVHYPSPPAKEAGPPVPQTLPESSSHALPAAATPADLKTFEGSPSQMLPAERSGVLLNSGLAAAATSEVPPHAPSSSSSRRLPPAPEPHVVANRTSIVAVSPAPEKTPESDEPRIAEPIELSRTELTRAVDFERVWREQKGDVPTMIPLPPDSAELPAVGSPEDVPPPVPEKP